MGLSTGFDPLGAVEKREITVDNCLFSTFCTGLSTTVIHNWMGMWITAVYAFDVDITQKRRFRQIVQFLNGFLRDKNGQLILSKFPLDSPLLSGEKARTLPLWAGNTGLFFQKLRKVHNILKKGIDFIRKVRYNVLLHKRLSMPKDSGTGGVIHAQHQVL